VALGAVAYCADARKTEPASPPVALNAIDVPLLVRTLGRSKRRENARCWAGFLSSGGRSGPSPHFYPLPLRLHRVCRRAFLLAGGQRHSAISYQQTRAFFCWHRLRGDATTAVRRRAALAEPLGHLPWAGRYLVRQKPRRCFAPAKGHGRRAAGALCV